MDKLKKSKKNKEKILEIEKELKKAKEKLEKVRKEEMTAVQVLVRSLEVGVTARLRQDKEALKTEFQASKHREAVKKELIWSSDEAKKKGISDLGLFLLEIEKDNIAYLRTLLKPHFNDTDNRYRDTVCEFILKAKKVVNQVVQVYEDAAQKKYKGIP